MQLGRLAIAGFDENTSFAAGQIQKDETGKLNGVIEEYACYIINSILTDKLPMEDITTDIKRYYHEILSLGITSN